MRAIAIAAGLFLLASFAGCGSSGGGPAAGVASATFNSRGQGSVTSVSCAAAGDCTAGGYQSGSGGWQAFVVSETNGSWGTAIEVPGTATLNIGGHAGVTSISCAAAGDCAAGGYYRDRLFARQAFVVSEKNGAWGKAVEVPGTAALNTAQAGVTSISCAAAGDCAAGGYYLDHSGSRQASVVSETNGTWGTAIEVPGTATLNTGGQADVGSISCAAAGDCAVGGYYSSSGGRRAFVVSETDGSWGTAIEVPGTATLNTGDHAGVTSISCATAGACAAGGYYRDGHFTYSREGAFVVDETNGTWADAIEVPGTSPLDHGSYASVNSVSCATAHKCAAAGFYYDGSDHRHAFVASETNGSWRVEVPGTAALSDDYAAANSISCTAVGECAAAGDYTDRPGKVQSFVVNETNGSWGNAIEVPGTATLNSGGYGDVESVSCGAAGECAAGGYYSVPIRLRVLPSRAFVVGETNGSWGNAIQVFPAP